MKKLLTKKQESGFTLIELLIVMVIIGLLALLVVNQFTSARDRAFDTDIKNDVAQLANKIELEYAENSKYPTTTELSTAAGMESILEVQTAATEDPDGNLYAYAATATGGAACDNTATDCDVYTISGTLKDGTLFTKSNN